MKKAERHAPVRIELALGGADDGRRDGVDSGTLRAIARLARSRAEIAGSSEARTNLRGRRDGLERLGAARALEQLARDLDVSADELEARPYEEDG